MRSTSVKVSVSTAIIVALLAAAPAEGARRSTPRDTHEEMRAVRIIELIREAVSRTFGAIAQALPTIPIPGDDDEEEKPIS